MYNVQMFSWGIVLGCMYNVQMFSWGIVLGCMYNVQMFSWGTILQKDNICKEHRCILNILLSKTLTTEWILTKYPLYAYIQKYVLNMYSII